MIAQTLTLTFDPPITLDSGPNRGPFDTLQLAHPQACEMQKANGAIRNGINAENGYLRDALLIAAVTKRLGCEWPLLAIDRIPDGKRTEAANFLQGFAERSHLKSLTMAAQASGDDDDEAPSAATMTLELDPPIEIETGPAKGKVLTSLDLSEPLGGEMRVANGQVRAGVNHENVYSRNAVLISLVAKRCGNPISQAVALQLLDGAFTEAANFLMGFQELAHMRSMRQAALDSAAPDADQTTDA